MNVKISVFVICVEAIIYLLSYHLHDCTFNASVKKENGTTEHSGKIKNAFSLNEKHFVIVRLPIRILIFMWLTAERDILVRLCGWSIPQT